MFNYKLEFTYLWFSGAKLDKKGTAFFPINLKSGRIKSH